MNTQIQSRGAVVSSNASGCADWTIHEYESVSSTNLIGAGLAPWTAVRADTQTAGRGRFQRSWVSDRGGLWLSAVVPLTDGVITRRAVPLAGGLAVCRALCGLGMSGMRLRWPNDVMVNDRKLAGLLIDQFVTGSAVVGIGLNVTNRPEKCDVTLANQTSRLADLLPEPPDLKTLARLILQQLKRALNDLAQNGAAALFQDVNQLWGAWRKVELDLNGILCQGIFNGVDSNGRLLLADELGKLTCFEAHEVRHLTEMECLS